MGNEIRAIVSADISGLRVGMEEAKAAVKNATASMAEAQAQFGKAAQEGNEQAAAALQMYRDDLAAAQAQLASFTGTQKAATSALRASSSGYHTAYTEAQLLSGSMYGADMAAARFLSTVPALSAALQSAFSVFGVAALVDVFVQVGEGAYNLYEKFISLDAIENKFTDDVKKLQQQDFINVHSIEVASQRLQQATRDATNLRAVALSLHSEGFKEIFSGNIGAGIGELFGAKDMEKQSVIDKTQTLALDRKKLQAQHELSLQQIETNHAADGALTGQQRINAELAKKLALDKENQQYAYKQDRLEGNITSPHAGDAMRALKDQQARGEAQAQSMQLAHENIGKQEAALRQGFQQQYALQEQQQQMSVFSEKAFWQQRLEIAKPYPQLFGEIESRIGSLSQRAFQQEERAVQEHFRRMQEEAQKNERVMAEANKAVAKMQQQNTDDLLQAGQRWKQYHAAVEKAGEIQRKTANEVADALAGYQLATGQVSRLAAAQAKAKRDAEEYKKELKALNEELQKMQDNPLADKSDQDTRVQKKRNQITQVEGEARVSGIQNQSSIAQAQARPWITAAGQVEQAWTTAFDKILVGGRGSWFAIREAEGQMAMSAIHDAENLLQQWIQKEAKKLVIHATNNQIRVASDATAAAASTAIKQQEGFKQALVDAKNAAVAGWRAGMALPFPEDVIVAPLLAAAGFAGAMAQFDTGTSFVPRDGVAMLHAGESVLPPPQTQALRDALNGNSQNGQSRSMNIHYNPVFQSGGTPADARTSVRSLHKVLRKANMVP